MPQATTTKKQHNFAAETGRILELLTHSIYSNKEIFLRELISNASDAIDKARLKSLTDTDYLGDDTKFEIQIDIDTDASTLSITDNGIGMTQKEIHDNIGTIAKSGTKEFLEKLEKAKEGGDHNLIGQFGVGFYSAFMVADSIEVITRSGGAKKAYKWSSDGKSSYELEETKKDSRGTTVILHLGEGNKELLEDWKIRELIKKYSNYVGVPIMMKELDTRSDEEKKKEKKQLGYEQVNETKPLWKKPKGSIKDDQYKDFYQSVSMDFNAPLGRIHSSVEGNVNYNTLLFIPQETNAFADMRDPAKDYGPKLYVQNVLILEHAKELLPVWLRFVSGVVETSDLPLNISREMLQSNKTLETIKKSLVKKIISELKKLREKDQVAYTKFFENYGSILKEGVYYEHDIKQDIASVLEFDTFLGEKKVSLDEYLEKNNATHTKTQKSTDAPKETSDDASKPEQTIYYITGKSRGEVLASPYLSQFRDTNTDVLLLTDPIDEWLIGVLDEYNGAKLKSVTASDIQLKEETEEEKKKAENTQKQYKDMLELIKNTIGAEKIEKVELNNNLGNALGAIKTPDGAMNPQMEKMMKAMGQPVPETKRILELNPNNKLVKAMQREFKADVKSRKLKELTNYAYNQAVLLEGGELENIADFVNMTNKFAGEYLKD